MLEAVLYQAPSSKYGSINGADLLLPLDMKLDISSNLLGDTRAAATNKITALHEMTRAKFEMSLQFNFFFMEAIPMCFH